MKNQELYKMVLRAKKSINPKADKVCSNCFSKHVCTELNKANIGYNRGYRGSTCSNALFYLEDLGIIKILQGVPDRRSGVDCEKLKVKILYPEGNKI